MSNPNTKAVLKLLQTDPELRLIDWQNEFSDVIGDALFEINPDHQVVQGPDGFPYFRFVEPTEPDGYPGTTLDDILDLLLEHRVGLAIFDKLGETLAVIPLGEVMSYALYGKTEVVWGSPWDEPSDPEIYEDEKGLFTADPNDDLFPQLLRDTLRNFFKGQPEFAEKVPAVTLIRAVAYEAKPEMPSDLVFNTFGTDYEDPLDFEWMVSATLWHIPPHLRNRIVFLQQNGMLEMESL
jgi:hypothetical protein